MSLVLTFVVEVIDCVAISKHDGIVAPLVTKNINQQAIAGATRLTLKSLIGTHHLAHVTFLYQSLECRQISLPKVAIGRLYIHRVAQGLWTTMYGIVLGTSVGLEVFVVVTLHTQYGLYAQNGIQIRILTTSLLATPPTWITEDVDIRTPESQLRISWIVNHPHRNIK